VGPLAGLHVLEGGGRVAAHADGLGEQARTHDVADGEDLGIGGLVEVVDLDVAAFGGDGAVEHAGIGHVAHRQDDRVRRQEFPGGEHDALVRDFLGEARPLELGADGLGILLFLAEGGRLLDVDEGDVLGAQAGGFGGHVAAHVAGADDDHGLAHRAVAPFGGLEEGQRRGGQFLAGHGQHAGHVGARGQDREVVVGHDPGEFVGGDGLVELDVGQDLFGAREFGVEDFLRNAAGGDGRGDLAAEPVGGVVDHGVMAG